jgi:glycosyltransferase involved in cell wall biosynthesis
MAKRRRIALIYEYNENWIGGTYYIQNLISALQKLENTEKPSITILCKDPSKYQELKDITRYSFLQYKHPDIHLNILQRIINKATRTISGKNIFSAVHNEIDVIFPATQYLEVDERVKKIYWIPDLQEHYLPQFFDSSEIQYRKNFQERVISHGRYIVFSSNAAMNDFDNIYPNNKLEKFVIPFAVSNKTLDNASISDLLVRYNIHDPYFICCNQFWQHKNHKTVLEAIALLKSSGLNAQFVFTGKEHDYRNPEFFGTLKDMVVKFKLEDKVLFLGFIPREDQLILMKNAISVIQPSLFEGWSTVIEDGKSLGCNIIASDITVHKEQLTNYSGKLFFDAENASQLAACIINSPIGNKINYNYNSDINRFGKSFNDIVNKII